MHAVEIDLPLSPQSEIDIVLIQWHSKDTHASADDKKTVIQEVLNWLLEQPANDGRPLFLVTPELSTPGCCLEYVEQAICNIRRPTVAICGMQYLTAVDFRGLIESSQNPEPESWIESIGAEMSINAAIIWICSGDGEFKRFVQPKLWPAASEQGRSVHACEKVLLFCHNDSRPSAGINFLVQICSDFCSGSFVSQLRTSITEQVQDNVRLDLAFLLQWNQDQDRPEFRDGTNAYFDVPVRKVITDAGAVLFVNNASSEHSKSVNNWGRSQFRFKFNKWKLIGGEHTYFIRQVSGEDFQAVILRESGPSIYRIVYKPAYLVSSRPGSGQMVPFVKASHWHIPGDTSSLGPGSVIAFKPIVAAVHWWQLEWRDCANGFANFLVEQGLVQSLAETCQEICHLAVKEWVDLLTDTTACAALSAYYKCCEGEPGYPYCWQPGSNTRKEYEAREPNEWTMASTGMRRWICAHTLLKIAQADLRPMPTGSIHAAIGDKIKVGYIWGDCKHSPRHMLDACHEQVPKEVWLSDTVLWVLVYPSVREDKAALGDYLKDRIDRGQPTADMGSHLEAGGDVILAEGAKQRFLYADELVGCLRSTDGKDEALESVAGRLQSTLMEALSDGA